MAHDRPCVRYLTILLLLASLPAFAGAVTYVDTGNATGPWDGKSWATAYRAVQEAIDAARDAGGAEVWVARGTYRPTSDSDRTVSFRLRSAVAVYGGFAGTETVRGQRDRLRNVTMLSGDIGRRNDPSDNSYHVVVGANEATLDGFTIVAGQADGVTYHGKGGGMVNYENVAASVGGAGRGDNGRVGRRPDGRADSGPGVVAGTGFSPEVANCTFTGNYAREGGAMYNYDAACPTITRCTFTRNSADKGGAMVNRMAANCSVSECIFSENKARWRGGAVFIDYGASVIFTKCIFAENTTDGNGGGIYVDDTSSQIGHTSPEVIDCRFIKNTAGLRGGGIANFNKCTPSLNGCTFEGNHAGKGGGAIANDFRVTVRVSECTFSGNSTDTGEADVDTDSSSAVTEGKPSSPRPERLGSGDRQKPPPFPPPGRPGFRRDALPGSLGESRARQTRGDRMAPSEPPGRTSSARTPTRSDLGPVTVYVDANNAKGPKDGKSWATAYRTVQEGIDAAANAGGGEVWVAEGTYKPTSGSDRTISIELKSGVAVYGGFNATEANREQRDWKKKVTILSGDIGAPGNRSDNSIHVVEGADNATMDGFTIVDGQARAGRPRGMGRPGVRRPGTGRGPMGPADAGGPSLRGPGTPRLGMRAGGTFERRFGPGVPGAPGRGNQHLTPRLIASGFGADNCGGGMYNLQCSPMVANCIFTRNAAGKGGGMYNSNGASPIVINCTFPGNGIVEDSSNGRGGGMSNDLMSRPILINCTFTDNASNGKGGAIYNDFNCSPFLANCVFAGNSALRGGGMASDGGSRPTLTNCTFTRNYAGDLGGAIYNGTYRAGGIACSPNLTNCILWGNLTPAGPKEISNWHEDSPVVSYSIVEGGYPGEGNGDTDPLFVDAEAGDFRLPPESPCIDAGNGTIGRETAAKLIERIINKRAAATSRGSRSPRQENRFSPRDRRRAAPLEPVILTTDRNGYPRRDCPGTANGRAAGDPPVDIGANEWQGGE